MFFQTDFYLNLYFFGSVIGPDAYEFAGNKPLTLISGGNLLFLLQKHGHKAKIDLKEAKEYFNAQSKK